VHKPCINNNIDYSHYPYNFPLKVVIDNDEKIKCPVLPAFWNRFSKAKALRILGYELESSHKENVAEDLIEYCCKDCGKVYKSYVEMHACWNSHKVKCIKCHRLIVRGNMARHLKTHGIVKEVVEKQFKCDIKNCSHSYDSQSDLNKHKRNNH